MAYVMFMVRTVRLSLFGSAVLDDWVDDVVSVVFAVEVLDDEAAATTDAEAMAINDGESVRPPVLMPASSSWRMMLAVMSLMLSFRL